MRSAATLALIMLPWLGLATPACDDGGKKADPADPAAGPAAAPRSAGEGEAAGACDQAHGKAIEQEMLAWCALSEKVAPEGLPVAPWKPAAANKPRRGIIDVRPSVLQVGWEQVEASQVLDRLAQDRQRAETMGETHPGWSLVILGDTPRAEVAAVLKALADGEQRVGSLMLGVEATEPVPAPRDPKRLAALHAKLDGADPSQRAATLAQEIQAAMPPCPGMTNAFSAVAAAAPDQRCPLLARGLSEGLVGCKCPKEDEMLTLIYAISLGSTPPGRLTAMVPVTLDPAAPPRPGATWAEVVAGLDEAALGSLWID
ncbi:MAG: hypothetical protein KDK70_07285 [Myxococcales bacterium]|nr:hypothetical protein [Myxococcales bacterium]